MEENYPQQEGGEPQQDQWQQQPSQDQWQQQPQQQPQQPAQQPYQQQYQQPQKDFFEDLVNDKTLAMVVMLGLLIVMVGAILLSATNSIDDSRHVITIGNILKDVGVFLLSGILLVAAFYRDEWNIWLRVGMAGFALVLIVVGYFPIGLEFGAAVGMGGGI